VNATKPEIEGDYTIVLFAFVKQLGKSPDVLGNELGNAMLADMPNVLTQFNIVKGFLNFTISNAYWFDYLNNSPGLKNISIETSSGKTIRKNLYNLPIAEALHYLALPLIHQKSLW
jgi:arginyl-tRNA synthetase